MDKHHVLPSQICLYLARAVAKTEALAYYNSNGWGPQDCPQATEGSSGSVCLYPPLSQAQECHWIKILQTDVISLARLWGLESSRQQACRPQARL